MKNQWKSGKLATPFCCQRATLQKQEICRKNQNCGKIKVKQKGKKAHLPNLVLPRRKKLTGKNLPSDAFF
jgi:hypothetical protein